VFPLPKPAFVESSFVIPRSSLAIEIPARPWAAGAAWTEESEADLEELPAMLTVDEAAVFFRVNRKTLYEAIEHKLVPGVIRLGKTIRISRDALMAFLSGQGRVSNSSRGSR
jgi:excisionase family DNA binding protein